MLACLARSFGQAVLDLPLGLVPSIRQILRYSVMPLSLMGDYGKPSSRSPSRRVGVVLATLNTNSLVIIYVRPRDARNSLVAPSFNHVHHYSALILGRYVFLNRSCLSARSLSVQVFYSV